MSIVALKRKSDIMNSSISSNNQFSINGGYRNQGWIGHDSRGEIIYLRLHLEEHFLWDMVKKIIHIILIL